MIYNIQQMIQRGANRALADLHQTRSRALMDYCMTRVQTDYGHPCGSRQRDALWQALQSSDALAIPAPSEDAFQTFFDLCFELQQVGESQHQEIISFYAWRS